MSFRICTIGCGSMANKGHGPSYKKYAMSYPDTELAACCDLDESKAKAFKEKFGFSRFYTDMDVMLDNEKPDAVCLVSPVALTAELSCRIMEKGYPLLMEKPPGLTGEETLKMIEAAQKNNVPNQVAFNRRYAPVVKKLMESMQEIRKENPLQSIIYQFTRVGRKDKDFSTTAIHAIDTAKFIAGSDYEAVTIDYQEIPGMESNVVNIYMHCTFASGARAQICINPVSGCTIERMTVNLADHSFFAMLPIWNSIDLPGRLIHSYKNEVLSDVSGLQLAGCDEGFVMNGFYAENEAFFNDIRAGRKPADDIVSGLQSVEIAQCIRKRLREYRKK